MDNDTLFSEIQRFRKPWLWALLIGSAILTISSFITQIRSGQNQDVIIVTLFPLLLVILVNILFVMLRLETLIKEEGIYVRFFPFHVNYKFYPWSNIEQVYVKQYSPIAEYGGWGLRLGLFGKGRAYNVSGDKGIQIIFKDGSKLLIGTNKPKEARASLEKVGNVTA